MESTMATAIPIEIFELLEKKVGREEAKEIIEVIDAALQTIEKRAEAVALEKKLEVKDELTRELATKADIAELGGEIKLVRQEMQTMRVELDRKFTILFVILFFTIVFLNQNALEFLARVLRLIP
jgi:heme oxygenase